MRDKFQKVLTVATPNFGHFNFIPTVFDKMLSAADLEVYYPNTRFGDAVHHWADQRHMANFMWPELNKEVRTIDAKLTNKILDGTDPDVVVVFMQHLSNPQGTMYLRTFVSHVRKRHIPTLRAVPDRRDGSLSLDFINRV